MNNPRICPVCSGRSLRRRRGTYHFGFPEGFPIPSATFHNVEWDACDECGEDILSGQLEARIEAKRFGGVVVASQRGE